LEKGFCFLFVILSFILYGGILLVPLTALSSQDKIILSSFLILTGEASFWIAAFIIGKEAIARYRKKA
jgi:hypothetical protein